MQVTVRQVRDRIDALKMKLLDAQAASAMPFDVPPEVAEFVYPVLVQLRAYNPRGDVGGQEAVSIIARLRLLFEQFYTKANAEKTTEALRQSIDHLERILDQADKSEGGAKTTNVPDTTWELVPGLQGG